ncbi:MAG: alpha/beta hydrolase [Hyphomicrobiales bacterium]|nr:alpha/beta hydrolase [Hyphomicrobiales bacterium]MDE2018153.1 alpha/beta hydrolase [Hyphomicrobiales bacterium]
MRVRAPDGANLRAARWLPGAARGTVLLMQGRSEYIEKYFETIGDLLARGFAVLTFDWRGQGGSDRALRDPRKGHVEDFDDYRRDLLSVIDDAMTPCPEPWFGLAHSMGGAIALDVARRGDLPLRRLVLSAPMIDIHGLDATGGAARALARTLDFLGLGDAYAPGGGGRRSARPGPFEDNPLTGDERRYARMVDALAAAPELSIGGPTIAWLSAAFARIDALADPAFAPSVRMPTLALTAGDERIVSTRATERFMARMKTGAAVALPGARHEILMERDAVRAKALAAFDAFIPGG